jgi:hypothetical protein
MAEEPRAEGAESEGGKSEKKTYWGLAPEDFKAASYAIASAVTLAAIVGAVSAVVGTGMQVLPVTAGLLVVLTAGAIVAKRLRRPGVWTRAQQLAARAAGVGGVILVAGTAGVVAGVVADQFSGPARANPPVVGRPLDATGVPTESASSQATSASTPKPSRTGVRLHTEVADHVGGIPVFASPDGTPATAGAIPIGTSVQVQCYADNESGMPSVNYFYLIQTPPWKGDYASANAFANGATIGVTTGADPIDPSVPACTSTEQLEG